MTAESGLEISWAGRSSLSEIITDCSQGEADRLELCFGSRKIRAACCRISFEGESSHTTDGNGERLDAE